MLGYIACVEYVAYMYAHNTQCLLVHTRVHVLYPVCVLNFSLCFIPSL